MIKNLAKNYKQDDRWQYLVEECHAIVGQRLKNARSEVISGYAELGCRVANDPLYKKYGKGNQGFINDLADEAKISPRSIYQAIQFYEKYLLGVRQEVVCNALQTLNWEEGENISWHKIVQKLPEGNKTETPPLPKGKYQVIYADIPWAYDVDLSEGATRSPTNNYPVMDLEEIKNFGGEVRKLAAEDCVLFMWITAPKLNWMNDVLEAWGFQYKTNFIWDKIKPNMGHYSSVRHEILIIAGKGKCAPTCDGKTIQSIDSVQSIEKTSRHSEKPHEFRNIIETLYPNYKKIELFARGKAPKGWAFWGNEADEN